MVELRRSKGWDLIAKQERENRYDDIIVDGQTLGLCYLMDNKIHWNMPKSKIPMSIRMQAMRLCRERNERIRKQRQMAST